MKILVINCGSSSFKYQLLDMDNETALASGLVERIGAPEGRLTYKSRPGTPDEKKLSITKPFESHKSGMEEVLKLIVDPEKGVAKDLKEISAVGHRIVQGGEKLVSSCIIGPKEKAVIAEMSALAPLHNPANLQGVETVETLLPHAPAVGVFDTQFHATLPPKAFMYALPYEMYEKERIRRYGFHGTSHRYVAKEAARFLNKPLDKFNAITCHLGQGCSITAIEGGRSVDTSMGLTPLSGPVMGTRSGDVDPAILIYLAKKDGLNADQLNEILNSKSGLKGICGLNDMRDIHEAREAGDKKAQLAFDLLCYSVKKYIGAYYAVLGRIDALIFTAGIGENDEFVRFEACRGLEAFGIAVDAAKNDVRSGDIRVISPDNMPVSGISHVPVMIVPTNEELYIARETLKVLSAG